MTAASVQPAPRLGAGSDVDRLLTVLLHRPGPEVTAISEVDPARALFASAPDPEGLRREHAVLAALLRDHDVEVLYLDALLTDILGTPAQRQAALALALPGRPAAERARLAELPALALARALTPLPNLLYARDTSAWVGACVVPGTMREPVRRDEGPLLDAVYRLHPRFAGATVRPRSHPPLEGGDILPAGDGRVLIGISERTDTAGALLLAAWLLTEAGGIDEVVTIELPPGAGFHLDLVLTLVDHDTYAVWAPARDRLRAHRWRRGPDGTVRGTPVDDPLAGARVIALDGEDARAHGREWDHGTNLLALAPGKVMSYADNARANERLRREGVEVVEVPAEHLAAGRGGPRCLTCPVARAVSPR